MEPHPLEAPEVLWKEPAELPSFQFDFTDSQQLATGETLSSIDSTSVTPGEDQHAIPISDVTGGPLFAGETLTAPDGDTAIALAATASGDATVSVLVPSTSTFAASEVLTGSESGATVTLSAANEVGNRTAQGLTVESSSISGLLVEVSIGNGLRPVAGAPHREYIVTVLVTTSTGQKLNGLGRVRIAEAPEANNAQ